MTLETYSEKANAIFKDLISQSSLKFLEDVSVSPSTVIKFNVTEGGGEKPLTKYFDICITVVRDTKTLLLNAMRVGYVEIGKYENIKEVESFLTNSIQSLIHKTVKGFLSAGNEFLFVNN